MHLQWSYIQLKDASLRLAASLHAHGVRPGTSVAVFFTNGALWPLFHWASARLGAALAALDPLLLNRPDDLLSVTDVLKPALVAVQDAAAAKAFDAAVATRYEHKLICSANTQASWQNLSCLADSINTTISLPALSVLRPTKPEDSIARILFTGGSTGAPKACPHSVGNISAETEGYSWMRDLTKHSKTLVQSPVHHIMASAASLLSWRAGACVVMPAARFDPGKSLAAIEDYQITYLPVHHSMSDALITHPNFAKTNVKSLRYFQIGGALIGPRLLEKYHNKFGSIEIFPFWGMTECMYATAWCKGDRIISRNDIMSVGHTLPGGRVRVAEPGTRHTLARGQVGELHVGDPTAIRHYLGNQSQESFYTDEYGQWFMSGDQGIMDDHGCIHELGRYKDLIKRGGENIFPQAVEQKLLFDAGIKVCHYPLPMTIS